MNSPLLEINGIKKSFDGINALNNLSASIYQGEILGLIGSNGAGKTTLFNLICGFIEPDNGKILLKKKQITGLMPYEIAHLGIARTFQELRLIKQISVLDNILLSFKNQAGEKLKNILFQQRIINDQEKINREIAVELLYKTGLIEKRDVLANDLSYGQQKLLSIICALVANAEILLLDEPIAGIAPEIMKDIIHLISELPKEGKTVILIEHNLDVVKQLCHRVFFIDAGLKVCEGTPIEVINNQSVIDTYIK